MTEKNISKETAELAKIAGFNVQVGSCWYMCPNQLIWKHSTTAFVMNHNQNDLTFSGPTLTVVSQWLRENHKIMVYVDVDPDVFAGKLNYYPEVKDLSSEKEGLRLLPQVYRYQDHDLALERGLQSALKVIIKRNGK
jgi:hypothetical protein